ncbi:hypothetical protein [Bacillus paranthracis]|uniref:Uncharacterized protein n=1 Tax=Bacillus paranthracis TaxID=2026186 RepID=A0AAJ1KF78_9BACI|nr:hypothetical protein [Bacillus paranthracis]MDG0949528.1 hypothetical protein [Bacillus paranthracis]MDG0955360.1 hypothetical protein [Bacillus paranthracis]
MYDLTIGLEYDGALDLSPRYRYDFVGVPSGKCGFTTLSPFSSRFPHF